MIAPKDQANGPDPSGLTERLARLYTGIIFDVMRTLGIEACVLPAGIVALDSALCLAGPVWTVHGHLVEADPHETLLDWTRTLTRAPAGSVVVCQPENHEIALMGELSSEVLKHRGIRGYVVDGGCRDAAFIRKIAFPVYCRFTTPRDIVGRWLTDELGGSVAIGEAHVVTGDYLLADQDGIVVIPARRAEEVISSAEDAAKTENKVRTAILAGAEPERAYLDYGKF